MVGGFDMKIIAIILKTKKVNLEVFSLHLKIMQLFNRGIRYHTR